VLLNMLRRFSLRDRGSTDFLTFGFHVHAVKSCNSLDTPIS
jgi:hypothetical protein